jgi:type VI secretion system secreted protein VgrG
MKKILAVLILILSLTPTTAEADQLPEVVAGIIQCRPGEAPEFTDRVQQKLFDTSVHAGRKRAVTLLQEALNQLGGKLAVDGKLGPKTRVATCGQSEQAILAALSSRQAVFYQNIVRRDPSQQKFLKAWLRRAQWIPE